MSADSGMSDRTFGCYLAAATLLAIGLLSFLGWLAYLLVMHFTHGGAA